MYMTLARRQSLLSSGLPWNYDWKKVLRSDEIQIECFGHSFKIIGMWGSDPPTDGAVVQHARNI